MSVNIAIQNRVDVIDMPMPSKGERRPHTVRVPIDHDAVYKREAARRGMDYGTYVAWCMAQLHRLDWPNPNEYQEALPLPLTA